MTKYNIKQLINKEALDKQIEINGDGYGGACVNVAINIMEYLDNFEHDFNLGYSPDMTTTHGIICHCDDQGGITGYMAGAARNIVAFCHEKGWKFWLADVISIYDVDYPEKIDEYIASLMKKDELKLNEEDVRGYADGLIKRYNEKKSITIQTE